MENDRLYQLALTRVEGIGPVLAKRLIEYIGDAYTIFRTSPGTLEKIPGIRGSKARSIANFTNLSPLEKELAFCEKYAIRPLFYTDIDYPQRLLPYPEAPILLFFKGNADLNAGRTIAVIGTREPTEYGNKTTDSLIREIALSAPAPTSPGTLAPSGREPASPGTLVLSGLAYGIDAASHKAALKYSLPTVGVLGHGLDQIYPNQHRRLAAEMLDHGGLLTEYCTKTRPEIHNFPSRNRIVAGMCDALVVVETALHGGSLITVENARKYGKKIFAIPGKITDPKSAGCNSLIRMGHAICLTGGQQLMETMKWLPSGATATTLQVSLFPAPHPASPPPSPSEEKQPSSPDETLLLDLFRGRGTLCADEISAFTGLHNSLVTTTLLNLELSGLVTSLPGKRYRLAE